MTRLVTSGPLSLASIPLTAGSGGDLLGHIRHAALRSPPQLLRGRKNVGSQGRLQEIARNAPILSLRSETRRGRASSFLP